MLLEAAKIWLGASIVGLLTGGVLALWPAGRRAASTVRVAAGAAIAGFLKFLPFRPQENVEWVLLLLPLHWALLRSLAPKS